jgi:hypothetical protein
MGGPSVRYIVTTDGTQMAHVVPLATYPVKATRKRDNMVTSITGQKRANGQTYLYGSDLATGNDIQIVLGPDDFVTEDLEPLSVPGWELEFPDLESDVIGKWTPEHRATVTGFREGSAEEIPTDRTFRAAWRDATSDLARLMNNREGMLYVDMPTAREIQRERIRAARAPKLLELDVAYLRATEDQDPIAEDIIREKRALRDATDDPRIEAAETPEELKAVWPKGLEGR